MNWKRDRERGAESIFLTKCFEENWNCGGRGGVGILKEGREEGRKERGEGNVGECRRGGEREVGGEGGIGMGRGGGVAAGEEEKKCPRNYNLKRQIYPSKVKHKYQFGD
jgi:hypothetical protein